MICGIFKFFFFKFHVRKKVPFSIAYTAISNKDIKNLYQTCNVCLFLKFRIKYTKTQSNYLFNDKDRKFINKYNFFKLGLDFFFIEKSKLYLIRWRVKC